MQRASLVARPLAAVAGSVARRMAPCSASASAPARFSSEWLVGRPPTVSHAAGTVAAAYYKHVREHDIPTKDLVVAPAQDVKMSVQQFDRQVYAYAVGMLQAWNLKKGDKIAVWCGNELESVVAQWAAALIGVEAVVVDPSLGFAAVKHIINAEGVRALVLSARYGGEDRHAALLETEFAEELSYTLSSAGYRPLASKRFRTLKFIACTSREFVDGVMRFSELPVYGDNGAYTHDDVAALQSFVHPSQPAASYYGPGHGHGGAAAAPVKGRTLTHAQWLAGAAAAARALSLKSSDVVLVTAPVWTPAGMAASFGAAAAATQGAAKVVLAGGRLAPGFDAAGALRAAEAHSPTVVVTTPEHAAAMQAEMATQAGVAKGGPYEGALARLRGGLAVSASGSAPGAAVVLGTAKLASVDAAKGLKEPSMNGP